MDFIDSLDTVIGLNPSGYPYKIRSYFISNFSRAVILDQYVNRPNFVIWDLGKAMQRFFNHNPNVSAFPENWGEKQLSYELEIMEEYGINRRGTDMVKRNLNLKKYFKIK